MHVLVTGAAGFVGHHMVRLLIGRGYRVRALVHDRAKAQRRLGDVLDTLELVEADVTDPATIRPAVDGVDAVVHLVAIPVEKGDATYERINYGGTVHVVDAAREAGVERFVHLSQNGSNPKSFSPFIRSKGRANAYVTESSLAWTLLHPSLTFGEHDKVFNSLARLVRLTPLVFPLIERGAVEFQPVSVHDVVEVAVRCLEDDSTIGRHFSLGGPEVVTLGEITRRVLDVLGERRLLVPVPVSVLTPLTFVMARVLPQPPASVPLLRLLRVPNVVLHDDSFARFGMTPRRFAGEHLHYLRTTSAGEALRIFLGLVPE